MIEQKIDIWDVKPTTNLWVRCITTNGVVKKDGRLVMGAGLALDAKKKYSNSSQHQDIDLIFGFLVDNYGNLPFYIPECNLISYPTKKSYLTFSSPKLIEESTKRIKRLVEFYNIKEIFCPHPGCGFGGLKWENVKPILEQYFDDRFIICSK